LQSWEATAVENEFFVLTRVIDGSDPDYDLRTTIMGTWSQINAVVDLSRGVPDGWQLLKGKRARRFLRRSLKHEYRWQREQEAQAKIGGPN
jgi:hypothetical protein